MLHRTVPHLEHFTMYGAFPARWIDPRSREQPRLPRFRSWPAARQDFNYAVADVIKQFPKLHTLELPEASSVGTLFTFRFRGPKPSQPRVGEADLRMQRYYEKLTAKAFLEECPRLQRVLMRQSATHGIPRVEKVEMTRETLNLI